MAHTGRKDAPELPDFALLKRLAKDQLIYLLEQVQGSVHSECSSQVTAGVELCGKRDHFVFQLPGRKDLFIDADLMSPLDRIANVTTLKVGVITYIYPSDRYFYSK